MIKEAIEKAVNFKNLSQAETEAAFNEIMEGKATPSQIAAFLIALRMKGETIAEITAAAKVMRGKALKIKIKNSAAGIKIEPLIDTCGTGGTGFGTFNISTASAFVVAASGVKVAKHGNRSASSHSGSADVLEALGVNLNMPPLKVSKCINEIGIGFLFAPLFHTAMKYAAPVRKELCVRTIFNILGPLSNPAGASVQILGVYRPDLVEKLCGVLKNLGTKRALVVNGIRDSLDEISITGPTKVAELKGGKIRNYTLTPSDFGIKRAKREDIKGGSAKTNAAIIKRIFKGEKSPKRDIVLMNASAALFAAGKAGDFKEGVKLAASSIDSGAALDKLTSLIEFTNRN